MDKMTEEQERARMAELNSLPLLTAKDCVELFALLKGISAFESATVICDAIDDHAAGPLGYPARAVGGGKMAGD